MLLLRDLGLLYLGRRRHRHVAFVTKRTRPGVATLAQRHFHCRIGHVFDSTLNTYHIRTTARCVVSVKSFPFPCEKKGVCIYKVVYTKSRAVRRVEGLVGIVTKWKVGRLTAHARPHRLSRGERDDSRAEFQLGQRHLPPLKCAPTKKAYSMIHA